MMNRQLNLPQLTNIMREFERQNEKMEMTSDMMGDMMDDAFEVRETCVICVIWYGMVWYDVVHLGFGSYCLSDPVAASYSCCLPDPALRMLLPLAQLAMLSAPVCCLSNSN